MVELSTLVLILMGYKLKMVLKIESENHTEATSWWLFGHLYLLFKQTYIPSFR